MWEESQESRLFPIAIFPMLFYSFTRCFGHQFDFFFSLFGLEIRGRGERGGGGGFKESGVKKSYRYPKSCLSYVSLFSMWEFLN